MTMSWLNNSPFRNSFMRQRAPNLETTFAADPEACYASFKEHWQQAFKIIQRNQNVPTHDDVLGVVNHLEQMVTLLLYELKSRNLSTFLAPTSAITSTPCLEYLLVENLLDKVYEWGLRTGKYRDAVRLEQIKLYEVLVNMSSHELLVHEPFLRPLLKLLLSCQGECFLENVEMWLVKLLYQLCVALMQKIELLDLFFISTPNSENNCRFIIFSLLIPFVHREGAIGLQARDALLLCLSLSKKNINIAEHSNVCPMLATGLSSLYSMLPKTLEIEMEDWHRLVPDDVKDINELALFMNSLEFCNAVAQVAHPLIKSQLLDFIYLGFLIPILRSAILTEEENEQIAATAYLDLIMRSVTEPGLLSVMVRFLLEDETSNVKIIDILTNRIKSSSRLCLVTLALFETLVDLNCEDIMLELIFKHLRPCAHVMLSQRYSMLDSGLYSLNTDKLFSLVPNCCRLSNLNSSSSRYKDHMVTNGSGEHFMSLPTNWNHYGTQVNETLFGNYHAYLCDARQKIQFCRQACLYWTSSYDSTDKSTVKSEQVDGSTTDCSNSLQSLGDSSGYESLKYKAEECTSNKIAWKQSSLPLIESVPINNIDQSTSSSDISSSVGLFLDVLLDKLSNMISNNVYVNLHLTGLISRLAIYPQVLLNAFLLNNQLVLQPNVQSIFQVVGSLKHEIDEHMAKVNDPEHLLSQARHWLFDRENRILNIRKKEPQSTQPVQNEVAKVEPANQHSKSSLTNSLSLMFRRTSIGSNFLRGSQKNVSNHSSQAESILMVQNEANSSRSSPQLNNVALCAILLDEWLKELAAISQEQTISQISDMISKNFLN